MAAFYTPNCIHICRPMFRTISNQASTGLLMPAEAAFNFQLRTQPIGQGFEEAGVVASIDQHSLGQRAHGPISFLRTFLQFHPENFLDQKTEAELAKTEQTGRQHRIEDGVWDEFVMLAEEA